MTNFFFQIFSDRRKTRDEGLSAKINKAKGKHIPKLLVAQENRQKAKLIKENLKSARKSKAIYKNDIWMSDVEKPISEELKDEWISEDVAIHTMRNTRKLTVRAPQQIRIKPKKMKAIEIPHPGISYNPTLTDHQNLLQDVINKEKKIIKHNEHLDRVTTLKFSKITEEERDNDAMIEMSAGIDPEGIEIKSENESDDDDNNVNYKTVNGPVKNKKKDPKARRKQKEHKLLKEQHSLAKVEKRKIADLHRIKMLNKKVDILEQEGKETYVNRKKKRELKKYETSQMGPIKFKEAEIDVQLPENIAGNLRNVVPEGKLLSDRFNSLQKRNIIPTSKHVGLMKKVKVKRYTKNSHKEPQLPLQRKKNITKQEDTKINV